MSLEEVLGEFRNKFEIFHDSDMKELLGRWKHIGYADKSKLYVINQLKDTMQKNMDLFIRRENSECDELMEKVKNSKEILLERFKQLSIDCPKLNDETNLLPTYDSFMDSSEIKGLENLSALYDGSNKTVLEKSVIMEELLKTLDNIKTKRLEDFQNCVNMELGFIQKLCFGKRTEMHFVSDGKSGRIPSQNTVDNYQCHIQKLSDKIDLRCKTVKQYQENYIDIITKLNEMPDEKNEFEYNFIYAVEFDNYSDEIMEKYSQVNKTIARRLNERVEKIGALNHKIISIIKKLALKYHGKIDGLTYEEFQDLNAMDTMSDDLSDDDLDNETITLPDIDDLTIENLNKIIDQLETLEILKFQKLDKIIMKTEREVVDLNEVGYISELEKCCFMRTLKNTNSKEDQLDRLEERVITLKKHIEDNETIFNLVNKWQVAFEDMKALNDSQKDKDRLFKNRGGSLLAESKMRKKVEATLRNTEKKLFTMSQELGNDNCPRLRGQSVMDFIEEETTNYEQEKELEKQGRKMEKKRAIFQESMFGAGLGLAGQVKRGRHQNNLATKKSRPADVSKSGSSHGSISSRSTQSTNSSTFRKPLSARTQQTVPKTTPRKYVNPKSTPNKNIPKSTTASKKISGKENTIPSNRTGRTMAKSSVANQKTPVRSTKPSHVLEAEKIKRRIEKRRSRTPETLQRQKNTNNTFGRFKELPSHRANLAGGTNRYGFRRRSKSQTNLNFGSNQVVLGNLVEENEEVSDGMSESYISREKFNTGLQNTTPNFASSFISMTP